MTDALAKKSYPALKMPSPRFNVQRLEDGETTGLLSRVERAGRVGIEQVLVNELNKPGDKPFAYGIVKIGAGKRYAGIGAVPKNIKSGVDEFTMREFQAVRSLWFHPFELVQAFKPSIELKKPVPGRRFAADLEINLDKDLAEKVDPESRDAPEELSLFTVFDNCVKRVDDTILPSDISPSSLGPEFLLVVPGMINPWIVFPLDSRIEKQARADAIGIVKERRSEVAYFACRKGDLPNGMPVFSVKTKLMAEIGGLSEIEEILAISPKRLRDVDEDVLVSIYRGLHRFHEKYFAGNKETTTDGVSREDVVNAYLFVLAEMKRRGKPPAPRDELDSEAKDLMPEVFKEGEVDSIKGEDLAPINPSGEKMGRRITLDEVLEKIKPFRFRQDGVTIVGGLANNGHTDNDIDVLIKGPLDEETRHVIEFRIGRMLGSELSQRVQFLDDSLGGPFTNNVPLGNFAFEANETFAIKEMRDVGKQGDPLQELPKTKGKNPAVLQAHFRGRSLHLDLRMKMNGYLTGWTISIQKAGAIKEPVLSVSNGRSYIRGYDAEDGNAALKPILAPKGVFAVPKSAQPIVWLGIGDEVFEPGEAGATKEFPAVWVFMDRPKVEFGRSSPRFHEYFFTNGKILNGLLLFRQLVSEDPERGGTRRGEPFWRMFLSKEFLPSVLRRRTVREGDMPPPGNSWLPVSLERDVPKEFRYWEKRGAEAKKTRAALVDAKIFTEDTVGIVNNEFRLIRKKYFVAHPSGLPDYPAEEVCLDKDARTVDYTLSRQSFRGPIQIRAGFTKVFWWLVLDKPDGGVRAWKLQTDPLSKEKRISAIAPVAGQVRDKALLDLKGDIPPKSRFNETKNTPSSIDIVGKGKVDVVDDQAGFLKIRFKSGPLSGVRTLEQGDAGSNIWEFRTSSRDDEPSKKSGIPVEDGIQIWNPDEKIENADRKDLRPLAIFTPMKPRKGFFDPAVLLDEWATDAVVKAGVAVSPKWNGLRTIAESDGEKPLIYFEDTRSDRSKILPGVSKELLSIAKKIGPFIIDAELIDTDEEENALPRRTLSRFTGPVKPQDDSRVSLRVFHLLFYDDESLADVPYDEMRKKLDTFFRRVGRVKHLDLTPIRVVRSRAALREAIDWASKADGSEGAMFKMLDSTYSLGGFTSSWAKLKTVRKINARVWKKIKKKPSPAQKTPAKTWVYECVIGPIPQKDVDSFKETVKIGDNYYAPIGKTFATNVEAQPGDTLEVQFTEMLVNLAEDKKSVHWFTPVVVEGVSEKPATIEHAISLALDHEIKKFVDKILEKRLPIIKSDDERIVYGVVLEPEELDTQEDVYSEEEIRDAAHCFMEEYRHLGVMHRQRLDGRLKILETYLAPQDLVINGQNIKKGTWLMVIRVLDNDMWRAVKEEKLTGLSIGGSAIRTPERVEA